MAGMAHVQWLKRFVKDILELRAKRMRPPPKLNRTMNLGPGAVGPLTGRQMDEVRRIAREEIAKALPPTRLPDAPPDTDGLIKRGF